MHVEVLGAYKLERNLNIHTGNPAKLTVNFSIRELHFPDSFCSNWMPDLEGGQANYGGKFQEIADGPINQLQAVQAAEAGIQQIGAFAHQHSMCSAYFSHSR
uniref:Uncharacterized protein n=1 Tax=Salix viminalis TaxID=40686 RepID=A0A6N2NLS5_SALVM